jgi:hypothetical protein
MVPGRFTRWPERLEGLVGTEEWAVSDVKMKLFNGRDRRGEARFPAHD